MIESRDERFERRLIAWGLGLLSDEEAQQLREWWEGIQADSGGPLRTDPLDRHIPAGMLARWSEVEDRLEGLERDLVTRHLQRCDACREDQSILEELQRRIARQRVVGDSSAVAGTRPERHRPNAARWLPWLGGAAIGGALAASVMLAVVRPTEHALQSPRPQDGWLPWVSLSFARGAAAGEAAPEPGQPMILALTVPMGFPESDSVRVVVFDPAGAEVANFALAPEQIVGGSALVQVLPRGPAGSWPAGTYEVHLRAGDQSEVGEFVLRPSSVATKPAQK